MKNVFWQLVITAVVDCEKQANDIRLYTNLKGAKDALVHDYKSFVDNMPSGFNHHTIEDNCMSAEAYEEGRAMDNEVSWEIKPIKVCDDGDGEPFIREEDINNMEIFRLLSIPVSQEKRDARLNVYNDENKSDEEYFDLVIQQIKEEYL